MFETLVAMGFKEIEVGFPSASQPDFDFIRQLIEEDLIPDDVTIQVLTQSREELIERTYESIAGAQQAIVHFYNSTRRCSARSCSGSTRPASPTSPSTPPSCAASSSDVPRHRRPLRVLARELHRHRARFAVEICEAVMDVRADAGPAVILNLPATVEMYTPNVYAGRFRMVGRSGVGSQTSMTASQTSTP